MQETYEIAKNKTGSSRNQKTSRRERVENKYK
jgi:hypothetical protein